MNIRNSSILAINGGSSSLKFGLYGAEQPGEAVVAGKIERIGRFESRLIIKDARQNSVSSLRDITDHSVAAEYLLNWLEPHLASSPVVAIGHRIVFGGAIYEDHQWLTPDLLELLESLQLYDPGHLPYQIQLVKVLQQRHPKLPQVACFDTVFHSSLPRVAKLLSIPRRFEQKGMVRYGFHGLSYAFLMDELERVGGKPESQGRVILAHLGSGASLAAVREGKCLDTSMGLTPASGLMGSTRAGDLDPSLAWILAQTEGVQASEFHEIVNHQSGLLGVSELSSDIRDLLEREQEDVRAREAVDLFCYQTKKWIGAFVAVLGGVDTLVFSGGIGENAAKVRSRICEGLTGLGLEIDPRANLNHASIISMSSRRVKIRVLPTNEELTIARIVSKKLLNWKSEE